MRNALLALFCLLALAAGACSTTTGYDADAVDELINSAAEENFPDFAPFEVDCEDPPAEAASGATWTCITTDVDGDSAEWEVEGTDDEGNVTATLLGAAN